MLRNEPNLAIIIGHQAHFVTTAAFGDLSRQITSLSIRPSYGARGEEILDGGGGRGRRERKVPFSLSFFPFSPETPDTQASKLPTCPALSPVTRKQGKWRRRDHHSPPALLAFSRLVLPTEPLDNNNNNLYIYSALFNILGDQKRITTIKSLWRRQPHVPKRVIPICSAVVLFKPVKGNSDPFLNFI